MTKYQVTAKFGNWFEIVGQDEVDFAEANRLFRIYENTCYPVRMYQIIGAGSNLVKEAN